MRLDRSEPGEGVVLYFGEEPESRFIGVGLGFSGWEHRPGRLWSNCRFMNPYVHFGRLFSDRPARIYTRRVRIPMWLYERVRPR